MRFLKALLHIIIISLLTLVTQVGGVIWITVFAFFKWRKSEWSIWKRLATYLVVYVFCVFTVVPLTASLGNRKMLPIIHEIIKPHNLGYVLLCRNYVRDDLYDVMENVSATYKESPYLGTKLVYLDAGFPFIDGFPLLPHLSHNDGRKVDVAFVYNDVTGTFSHNPHPSLIGYGIYEVPQGYEINQTQICEDAGYWQYGYAGALGININNELELNKRETKLLTERIQSHPKVQKVFIEPHLVTRLGIKNINSKLRFHGCHAVRHDDHIHFQVNP